LVFSHSQGGGGIESPAQQDDGFRFAIFHDSKYIKIAPEMQDG
jgi:hypothetical protein